MSKQKIHSTTQDFTNIVEIAQDVVFFKGKSACMILEVSSVNFFLLSGDEQNARIYGYMSLLNSLSFAIQIFIISRRIDLSAYIKLLEDRITIVTNQRVIEHLRLYKEFIQELVKGEGLLDKKAYVVIPFSSLEIGSSTPAPNKKPPTFTEQARAVLESKRDNISTQIERMGLIVRPVPTEELVKLFYEIYNQDFVTLDFNSEDVKNIII